MSASENSFFKKEKKKSLKEILFQHDAGFRLLIAFICWICLALFLHFREVRIELMELNATADNYLIGTVDFEFPDDEATIILKQDAMMTIGRIYQIKASELRQARYDFENYLLHHPEWRNKIPASDYGEVIKTADAVEDLLLQARFTDAKTVQKMKELDLSVVHYLMFTPPAGRQAIILPREYWQHMKESSLGKTVFFRLNNVQEEAVDYVVNFFAQKKWSLIPDIGVENEIRELMQKNVPQKYTHVKAGTRIIEEGETITSRHLSMINAMQKALKEGRKTFSPVTITGDLLMALIFVLISGLYFFFDQRKIFDSLQKLSLIVCIIILTLAFAKITEYILLKNTNQILSSIRYPLIVPFAALLLTILINPRTALYFSFLLSIILAITLAVEHSCFLVINFVTSLVAVVAAKGLRKRKEVFIVSGKCLIAALPVIFAFSFIGNRFWSHVVVVDIIGSIIFTLVIAILVVGFLPILESLFNVMTDITLMEYMDPSNELLRRLTLEMPGTYQHSLVLGNIAEAAAQTIGANGLLCRVGTLYHDIGKLNNTHYFTENQQAGVNIHQLLTPVESAQVIISHITDGEILARKYRLPQPFIDIIREHHGTTLVYYFYCKEVELKGGNVDEVDETLFRYPGPKPHSKESAIIMIADAAEAASRSLEELSEQAFIDMVDRVVADRVDDGQFQECQLTFEELETVKKSIIKTLMVTRHVRVKYPEKP